MSKAKNYEKEVIAQAKTRRATTEFINIINDLKSDGKGNETYSPCIYGTMEKINDSDIMNDVITDYLHVVNGAL